MRSIIRKHHPAGIQKWLINSTVGETSDSLSLFNIELDKSTIMMKTVTIKFYISLMLIVITIIVEISVSNKISMI